MMPVRSSEPGEPKGTGSTRDFIPADDSLPTLREAVQRCQGCGLYAFATQAVFGEGPTDADLMLVGEQPGDREDVAREPFVVHPSSILRAADDASRQQELAEFIRDLERIAIKLEEMA